jgi:hypothetical protein
MINKIFKPATLIALSTATTTLTSYANECQGELYGINSGRGDLGIIFSLDEREDSAKGVSVAEFSSSALAYDGTNNRMYYISSPRPSTYKADISELVLSDDDKKNLPISGKKFRTTKLAYYDFDAKSHTVVGTTKSAIGMVYDPQSNKLLSKSYSKLYQIDPETAETTELASFDSTSGKYRGDLVIKDDRLLLITSSSVYEINRTNYQLTKLSSHGLSTVTGAALNPFNEIVISRTLINDNGHSNKSNLYILKPDTGKTCYLSSIPVRINDLATHTGQSVACYTEDPCGGSEPKPDPTFSLVAVKDSTMEGGELVYEAVLSEAYSEDVTVEFSISDISTSPADYNMPNKTVIIAAGETKARMTIKTMDNSEFSDSKQLKLTATVKSGMTGESSLNGTILNDDAQCVPKNYTRIHYNFISAETGHNHDWGVVVNGSFVKLLDQSPGSGHYDVLSGQGFYYRLAHNGNPGHLHSKVRINGNTQYWEDWHDDDWNDFVVSAWTQNVQKGCN